MRQRVYRPFSALAAWSTLAVLGCGTLWGPDYPRLPPAADGEIPDSVLALYREDAARLTARLLPDVTTPTGRQVELPADLVEQLYTALVAVHNAAALPARDTVVEVYRIHTLHRPATHMLLVHLDSTAWWAAAWRRGERLTGYDPIDGLLLQYDLSLTAYYQWSWGDAGELQSSAPLNIAALAIPFRGIAGVRDAEPDEGVGDGNDITAAASGAAWQLTYSLGCGDCPSGCIARRYWGFQIDRVGGVTYQGSWGNPPAAAR
jgi:hypothetical protein